MFKRAILTISFVTMLITALGCESGPKKLYEGPELDRSQVAIIRTRGGSKAMTEGNLFLSVDGKDVNRPFFAISEASVLPGKHFVTLLFAQGPTAKAHFEFQAEAGKTYIGEASGQNNMVQFWIEDAETGAKVGTPIRDALLTMRGIIMDLSEVPKEQRDALEKIKTKTELETGIFWIKTKNSLSGLVMMTQTLGGDQQKIRSKLQEAYRNGTKYVAPKEFFTKEDVPGLFDDDITIEVKF